MSSEMDLQHHTFDRARQEVVEAHDVLQRGCDALSDEARALLGRGWSGAAADEYAQGWEEWECGARRVLRSLGDLAAAMDLAHGELSASEDAAAARAGYLRSRLGGGS